MDVIVGKNWVVEFDNHFITLEEQDKTSVWPSIKVNQVMETCLKYTRLESEIILKLITHYTGKKPFIQSDDFVIEDLVLMDCKRSLGGF